MKVEELRIGNYVKLNSKDFHAFEDCYPMSDNNNIWSIECIFRDGSVEIYNNLENLYNHCEVSDIESIELNEKWLLKFGFIELPDGLFLHSMYSIAYYLSDNTVKVSDSWEFGDSVKYVHQLQNLYFALTNKELICETK